jgi:hypothetical protein
MTISANLERLSYGAPSGCIAPGLHRQVISEGVATRQLTPEESGSLCLFDRAAGTVYTLPTPVAGMNFEFLVTVAVTSNAHKVITKTIASEFLIGGIIMGDVTVASSGDYFEANGSSHVAISGEGSTTGGLLGERYVLTAISTTQWAIHGVCHGAGTLADPFGTS